MKNFFIISLLLLTLIGITGCSSNESTNVEPNVQTSWFDLGESDTELILSENNTSTNSVNILATGDSKLEDENYAYLRSSGVEFWSIETTNDIDDIRSPAGGGNDTTYATGKALYYSLPDYAENIYFKSGDNNAQDLTQYVDQNEWNSNVTDFKNNRSEIINLIRFDVGGGKVTFVVDGEEVEVQSELSDYDSGINANSFFFVDSELLNEIVYIPHPKDDQYTNLEEIDSQVVRKILENSIFNDQNNTPIDVSGGLFIPFEPLDISNYDPLKDKLSLQIKWNMKNAIYKEKDKYYMADRVKGTCFDFIVSFLINDQ